MIGSESMTEHKILVVDDDSRQIEVYLTTFCPERRPSPLKTFVDVALDASLVQSPAPICPYRVLQARQGEEAIVMAQEALASGNPIKVAFVDMRMPPGINGLETAKRLRQLDERIYIVIVTAYSDFDLTQIAEEIQENILFVRKPFQSEEVEQIARNFVRAWQKDRSLEQLQCRLESKVQSNLFEATLYEVSNGLLTMLADKINAQAGLVSYLKNQFDVPESQQSDYERVTQTVFVEAQQLSQMVRSLQRLGLSHHKVSVFSLNDLVSHARSLVPELEALPDQVALQMDYHISLDTTFHLPYSQLVLVLTILLRNALEAVFAQSSKQNDYQGNVVMRFCESHGMVEIQVEDNGIGMVESDCRKAFDLGFSLKNDHAGVGLSLVQFFVDAVAGSVTLTSEGIGHGASVCLRFPFSYEEATALETAGGS